MRLNSASRFQQTNVESFKKIYKGNRELFSKKTFKEGEERLETKDGYVVYLETLKDNSQVIKAVPAGEFKKQEKLLLKKSQELLRLLQAIETEPKNTHVQTRKVRPHTSTAATTTTTKAPVKKARVQSAPVPTREPSSQHASEQQAIPQKPYAPKPAPRTTLSPHKPPQTQSPPKPPAVTTLEPPLTEQTVAPSTAQSTPPSTPKLSRGNSSSSGFSDAGSSIPPSLTTSSPSSSASKSSQELPVEPQIISTAPSSVTTTPSTSRSSSVTESVTSSEYFDDSDSLSELSVAATPRRATEQERDHLREAASQQTINPLETAFPDDALQQKAKTWSDQLKQQCDRALKEMRCNSHEEEQALRTLLYAGMVSTNPGLSWPQDYYGKSIYTKLQFDDQILRISPKSLVNKSKMMIKNHQKYLSTHTSEQDRTRHQGRSFFDVLSDQQAVEKPKITRDQITELQEVYQKQQQQVFEYYLANDTSFVTTREEWDRLVERELKIDPLPDPKVQWMNTKTESELMPEELAKTALARSLPSKIKTRLDARNNKNKS